MIPVIDLFAGPGGLGEGFSSLRDEDGNPIFQTVMSIERDSQAHRTLRLRSYVRKILNKDGSVPKVYRRYMLEPTEENHRALIEYDPDAWELAGREALCAELVDGDDTLVKRAAQRIKEYQHGEDAPLVLIGGPPCQAYSLVGRSRRSHDKQRLEDDVRQTLYKCYLTFINELKPTVFVMENVKGLLSAQHKGSKVFEHIVSDMNDAGYEIHSLVKADPTTPSDYVVHAERYGIPQARHRVILLGIKKGSKCKPGILQPSPEVTVREAFEGIPKIRSGFSRRSNSGANVSWAEYIDEAAEELLQTDEGKQIHRALEKVITSRPPKKTSKDQTDGSVGKYDGWYRARLKSSNLLSNHEARTHMKEDLNRYLFCSAYADVFGIAPKLQDFPITLLPNHKNARGAKERDVEFSDRFRVQVYGRYSTTVTSHISKDGHYYIHPDPTQCRSLTVREAARLQTFPDDYFFEGNRTSQYTQVGNAVPPLLAQQIAAVVATYLGIPAHAFVGGITLVDDGASIQDADDKDSHSS